MVEVRDIKNYQKNQRPKNDIFSKLAIFLFVICRSKNIKEFVQIAEKLKEYNFILIGNGPKWNDEKITIKKGLKNIYLMVKKRMY